MKRKIEVTERLRSFNPDKRIATAIIDLFITESTETFSLKVLKRLDRLLTRPDQQITTERDRVKF